MTDRFTGGIGLLTDNKTTLLLIVVALVAGSAIVVGGLPSLPIQADSGPSPLGTDTDDDANATTASASEPNMTNQSEERTHEMQLRIHGSATPGDTLLIEATTGNDTPVADAAVRMNGETITMTNEDGHAEITVPDEEELVIEVDLNGPDMDNEVRIDIHQHADAKVDSEVDIEIKADNTGSSQSATSSSTTSSSQSTTSSSQSSSTSQSSSSSVETSTNVTSDASRSDE